MTVILAQIDEALAKFKARMKRLGYTCP